MKGQHLWVTLQRRTAIGASTCPEKLHLESHRCPDDSLGKTGKTWPCRVKHHPTYYMIQQKHESVESGTCSSRTHKRDKQRLNSADLISIQSCDIQYIITCAWMGAAEGALEMPGGSMCEASFSEWAKMLMSWSLMVFSGLYMPSLLRR